jgi:hypothetical protein
MFETITCSTFHCKFTFSYFRKFVSESKDEICMANYCVTAVEEGDSELFNDIN